MRWSTGICSFNKYSPEFSSRCSGNIDWEGLFQRPVTVKIGEPGTEATMMSVELLMSTYFPFFSLTARLTLLFIQCSETGNKGLTFWNETYDLAGSTYKLPFVFSPSFSCCLMYSNQQSSSSQIKYNTTYSYCCWSQSSFVH